MSAETENINSHEVLSDYYEKQKSKRILDQLEAEEERRRFCNLDSFLEVENNCTSIQNSLNLQQRPDIHNISNHYNNQISSKVKDLLTTGECDVNKDYYSLNSINNNFQMDTPSYEDILPTLYDKRLNNNLFKFGSESKINQLDNNSVLQLKLLKDFQIEVIQNIDEIKNKLILAEANYIKFLQQIDLKRMLLEKDQNLHIKNINLLEEKLLENEAYTEKDINEDEKFVDEERQKLFDIKEARMHLEDSLDYCCNEDKSKLQDKLLLNQEAEENQCFILDNLEFQLLEKKTQKEEEKDESLKQKNIILNQCEDLQIKLMNILTKKSEISRTISKETSELKKQQEHLSYLMREEEIVLHNIMKQIEIQERFYKQNINNLTKQHSSEFDVNLSYTRIRNLSKTLPRLNLYSPFETPTVERKAYTACSNGLNISPRFLNKPNYSSNYEDEPFHQQIDLSRYNLDNYNISNSPTYDNDTFYPPLNSPKYFAPDFYEQKNFPKFNDEELLHQQKNQPKSEVGMFFQKRNSPLMEGKKLQMNVYTTDYIIEPSNSQSDRTISVSSKEELSKNLRENECKLILEKAQRLKCIEAQTCPVMRYLALETDLSEYIINCGHNIEQCNFVTVTKNACRGYLVKMTTSILRPSWKKRWFVFDQNKRNVSYYSDRNEIKASGVIYFQSIEDVFADHLHQVKSPIPQLTFCLKTQQRMFYLVTPTADSLRIWLDVLLYALQGSKQYA